MVTKIYIYKSADDGFRWSFKRKGRIVADSGESYKTKAKLKRSLDRLISSFQNGEFEYVKDIGIVTAHASGKEKRQYVQARVRKK